MTSGRIAVGGAARALAGLKAGEREAIAPWFELREVSPGTRLTGEGAAGYSFFVIRAGTATVTIDGIEVRTVAQGDFFGELAILGEGRRTATVTAASPLQVLVLFGTEFQQLQQEYPELAAQIESHLRQCRRGILTVLSGTLLTVALGRFVRVLPRPSGDDCERCL